MTVSVSTLVMFQMQRNSALHHRSFSFQKCFTTAAHWLWPQHTSCRHACVVFHLCQTPAAAFDCLYTIYGQSTVSFRCCSENMRHALIMTMTPSFNDHLWTDGQFRDELH